MRRPATIFGAVILLAIAAFVFLPPGEFRHKWYHWWIEPRAHEQASSFAKSLVPVVTNDSRFAGIQLFVLPSDHDEPAILIKGAVQSEAALRALHSAVDATGSRFRIEWAVGVTNTLMP